VRKGKREFREKEKEKSAEPRDGKPLWGGGKKGGILEKQKGKRKERFPQKKTASLIVTGTEQWGVETRKRGAN